MVVVMETRKVGRTPLERVSDTIVQKETVRPNR